MTTASLIALDLLAALLAAAAWLGAGGTAAARRPKTALALLAAALLATAGHAATAVALATDGWWFAQEKLTLTLPLLAAAGITAALLAGPRLLRAARAQTPGNERAVVVPLLTAGYAAAAGLILSVAIGYPAGWTEALVMVALVGAAATVTWRAAGGKVPMWSVAAPVALGLVGVGVGFASGADPDAGGSPLRHVANQASVADLRGPETPAPGGEMRRFTLTARKATITLSSGRSVEAWTYNGQVPGPPLTATEGDLIEVTLRNDDIERGVTLHWHGYDVPVAEDGAPGLTQEAVSPGGEHVYRFRADQVGTYWYHTHQVSDRGVKMGLYGMLVVSPRTGPAGGLDLSLPVHTFGGSTVVGTHDRPEARTAAPGTPVRLRLVNTDSTPHRFTLSGTAYRLVAVDGNDLSAPGELTEVGLRLPAGGRYDLAFTMPGGPVALLVDGDPEDGGLRLSPGGGVNAPPDTGDWPELDLTAYGAPAATPFGPDSDFDRDFTLVLDRGFALVDGSPRYAHTVNGRAYPSVPSQVVRDGDLVKVTVANRSFETHPWHLHGHRVLVLARNGSPVRGSPLWLDTFDVRPGDVWEVGFRATNPGHWMNHCHNLGHAELGMALHLEYEGVTTPFHGSHGG